MTTSQCPGSTVWNIQGSCSAVVFSFAIQCTVIDLSDVRPLGQRADCVNLLFGCGKGLFSFLFSLIDLVCAMETSPVAF